MMPFIRQCVDMYAMACTKPPTIMTTTDNDFPRLKTIPKNESIPSIQIIDAKCTHSLPPDLYEPRLFATQTHLPSFFKVISFSRIASIINSERFLYPSSGFSWINSSIFFRRGSGILTVVYRVAIHSLTRILKITVGSNTVVLYGNRYIGGSY